LAGKKPVTAILKGIQHDPQKFWKSRSVKQNVNAVVVVVVVVVIIIAVAIPGEYAKR